MSEELRQMRHKTAMKRAALSRPLSSALRDRILKSDRTLFDYGCGHGTDTEILKASGFVCNSWDPHFFPNNPKIASDVVNLGFVLNVIENPNERERVLLDAYAHANVCLVVSVRIDSAFFEDKFGDGAVTKDGTFQKIYTQAEFRSFVESILGRRMHFVEPGIGYVFKDLEAEKDFKASKYLSRLATHDESILRKIQQTVDTQKIAALIADLGRMPNQGEVADLATFGKKKFNEFISSSVLPILDKGKYEENRTRVREDILLALAMTRIDNRGFLPFNEIGIDLQITIKEFFGDYKEACKCAGEFLLRLGKESEVARVARAAKVGKLLPEDLYIHKSAVEYLPGLLKLMLALAESIVGRVDCEVLKFSLHGKSMSFLFYQDFDTNPHPALQGSLRVDFRTGKHQVRDYSKSENPPIIHRKESFVHPEYEFFELFKSLSNEEDRLGLLSSNSIGYSKQWNDLLREKGVRIDGHEVKDIRDKT